MKGRFCNTDGLILAVIAKEPEIDLCKYISMIDAYYRIVPSFEELAEAIEKLQKNGILLYDNGELMCQEKAKKLLIGQNRLGMTSFMEKVSERILSYSYKEEYEVKYVVSRNEYDEAVRNYKKGIKFGG